MAFISLSIYIHIAEICLEGSMSQNVEIGLGFRFIIEVVDMTKVSLFFS